MNGTFVSSPSGNTDDVIVDALEAIGRHLGADRAYVLTYDFEERTESMTHEWAAPGTEPEMATYQDISFDIVPSGIIRSLRGEVVAVQTWDQAGPEWELDRQFLEAEGILSTIELPISRHGQVVGSVGFDWTTAHGTWSPQDLEVLRMFASSISQLLTHRDHRAHLQRQLDESQSRFATLVDNIPDPVMRVGLHSEVLFANAAARRQLLLDERGRLREDEAIWSQLREAQERALETLQEQVVAYRIDGPSPKDYETRIVPELDEFGQARSLLLLSTEARSWDDSPRMV
ncbi:MAG: GAF domain-containing protein [Acidimicrobiales bacterium]